LEASERDDVWTVRLSNLEARASYLDVALAQLLGNPREAHRAAARLLAEHPDLVEQRETPLPEVATSPRLQRKQISRPSPVRARRPLPLGARAFAFAVVAITAFMLTTWLSTLR
jgi:hypothetical protein